jgi:hypothetical protein
MVATRGLSVNRPRSRTTGIARPLSAQKICEAEHGPAHQAFDREVN